MALLIQLQTCFISFEFLTIKARHYLVIQKLLFWSSLTGSVGFSLAVTLHNPQNRWKQTGWNIRKQQMSDNTNPFAGESQSDATKVLRAGLADFLKQLFINWGCLHRHELRIDLQHLFEGAKGCDIHKITCWKPANSIVLDSPFCSLIIFQLSVFTLDLIRILKFPAQGWFLRRHSELHTVNFQTVVHRKLNQTILQNQFSHQTHEKDCLSRTHPDLKKSQPKQKERREKERKKYKKTES